MEQLQRKIRLARRRLGAQRFARLAPWFLFAALALAVIPIVVGKYQPLPLSAPLWCALAAVAGLVAAAGWVALTTESELDAAIEIDRRFALRERISSTYALSDEERASGAGQALIADAGRAIDRVEVGEAFRIKLGRTALVPLAPALAAFLVAVFLNPASQTATATPEATEHAAVKKASAVARPKVAELAKEARDKDLPEEVLESLTKLEDGFKQLSQGENDRRQALVKMSDLNKELSRRRDDLRSTERLKEQFEQMKSLGNGPAEELSAALRKGDFKQAGKELEALREKLQNGNLDDNARAELARQLDEMQHKLQAMTEKHKKAADELRSKIAEKRAAGQDREADALEEQLSRLQRQRPQMNQFEQMAQQMGQCAACTKQGDAAGAAEAMQQLQNDLSKLEQQAAEADLLDQALDQLADARDAMACEACNGEGCEQCQAGMGQQQMLSPGSQAGRGVSRNNPPGEEIRTGLYDTKVKQKSGRGAVTVIGQVDGPNAQGQAREAIAGQFEAVRGGAADPLADTKLPRGYRDHARTYFDSLREGEPQK